LKPVGWAMGKNSALFKAITNSLMLKLVGAEKSIKLKFMP